MQIDMAGQTVLVAGAAHPIRDALVGRLIDSGATLLEGGVPDLLILSAPLLEGGAFDWTGLADTAREIGMAMRARGKGRILFLISATAAVPARRLPGLSMRSAALQAAMRTLAMSLAPEVAVNALGIGAVGEGTALSSGDAGMIGHVPEARAGTVDESCNAALFLCDADNTYLTGQLLLADGGWSAGYGRSF
jgi:NAD(P)-dependent dehydrogenase (short-subunit alcohol dehydrogenase family)